MRASFTVLSLLLLLPACGASDAVDQNTPSVTVPSECASLPSFADAIARAEGANERVGTKLEGSSRAHVPGVAIASWLGRADVYTEQLAILVNVDESLKENLALYAIDVDPAKEAILVISYVRSESTLDIRQDGDTAHVYLTHAKACTDEKSAERLQENGMGTLVVVVPRAMTNAEMHLAETRFNPSFPAMTDRCTREGTVFGGGGDAGFLAGNPNLLFVNGFSAMTGNVFVARSADGVTWAPGGWNQDDLLSFDARGSFADVYSPSPVEIDGSVVLYARVPAPSDPTGRATIARFETTNDVRTPAPGLRFGSEVRVLEPSASGWNDGTVRSPSVLDRDGTVRLYYVGSPKDSTRGSVGLVTSEDRGRSFGHALPGPIVTPETFPFPVSSIVDVDVKVVDDHFEMWSTVWLSGGNPSGELMTAIAHLVSSDGQSWIADDAPLVFPRGDAEATGIASPAASVTADKTTLYVTAINARNEPLLERIVCPRR